MSASKALWLQNAALRAASRDGQGLDLTQTARGGATALWKLPDKIAAAGDQALILGSTDTEAVVAAACAAAGQTIWRPEPALMDDLRTNPEYLSALLTEQPVHDLAGYQALQSALESQRIERPLVADEMIDLVVAIAINRLSLPRMRMAFAEAYRVLRRGGHLVLTILLADEPPTSLPPTLHDLDLRYVPQETEIFALLTEARFHGIQIGWRADLPAKVVAGVELRAFVLHAYKGTEGVCLDRGHAVLYRGPWREVLDDDGHRYVRGERTAVCEKTYQVLQREPYAGQFVGIPCYLEVPADQAPLFDCNTPQLRDPAVTKGVKSLFDARSSCCSPSSGCC